MLWEVHQGLSTILEQFGLRVAPLLRFLVVFHLIQSHVSVRKSADSPYLNTGARHHVSVDNHWFGGEKLIEEVFIQIDGFYDKVIRTVTSCGGLGGIF